MSAKCQKRTFCTHRLKRCSYSGSVLCRRHWAGHVFVMPDVGETHHAGRSALRTRECIFLPRRIYAPGEHRVWTSMYQRLPSAKSSVKVWKQRVIAPIGKRRGGLMKGVTLVVAIMVNGEIDIEKQPVDTMRECISLAQTTQAMSPLLKVYCSEMEGDQLSWREVYKKRREQYKGTRKGGAR